MAAIVAPETWQQVAAPLGRGCFNCSTGVEAQASAMLVQPPCLRMGAVLAPLPARPSTPVEQLKHSGDCDTGRSSRECPERAPEDPGTSRSRRLAS